MIACDIKTHNLTKFKNKPYIINISGKIESANRVKDINNIEKFLDTVTKIS